MDPFVYIPEQRLVVCSECRHAVLPSNIDTHLMDKDTHNMPKEDRDQIIKEVRKIDGLIQQKLELNSISFPKAYNPPIPVLREPRGDGMKCQSQDAQGRPCNYIACQLQKIQKHYRQEHGWINPQKRGGQEAGREVEVPWKSGVHCPAFFCPWPRSTVF
jgi:hypothetical protein